MKITKVSISSLSILPINSGGPFFSQKTGDFKCCLRCWCFRCFWSSYRWDFIQPWGSVVLLPPKGESLSCQSMSINDSRYIRLCGEGMIGHRPLHWICCIFLENSFFCAMVTAITLKMLDPLGTGKVVLFQVTYDKVSFLEYTIRRHAEFLLFIRIGGHLNCFLSSSLGFSE